MRIDVKELWKELMMIAFIIILSLGVTTQSYAQELLLFDKTFTITEAEHGFHYFSVDSTFSDNWIDPFNYREGAFHIRCEIINYPSNEPLNLSICIWSDVKYSPSGGPESWSETCSSRLPINGLGVFTTVTTTPSSWWQRDNEKPVDFKRVKDFKDLFIVYWCNNNKNLSDWIPEEENCWTEHNLFFPMRMHITIVAVAKGYEFSGWK